MNLGGQLKIKTLGIRHVRGVKELDIVPDEKNVVIWGPNGSGKSAVVDAIDFLLTGRIPRLEGEGREGVTLQKHGAHIDSSKLGCVPEAFAEVIVPGISDVISIRRKFADPENLLITGTNREKLEDLITLAKRRQHSLSRREILDYIAAPKGVRSAHVQKVLHLERLESTRLCLVRVHGRTKSGVAENDRSVNQSRAHIASIIGIHKFDESSLINQINELRAVISGSPISVLKSKLIKEGLKSEELSKEKPKVNVKTLEIQIQFLNVRVNDRQKDIQQYDGSIRRVIAKIEEDMSVFTAYSRLSLLERGKTILDGSGVCPLCGHLWKADELQMHIDEEIKKANELTPLINEMNDSAGKVKDFLILYLANLQGISEGFTILNNKEFDYYSALIKELKEAIISCDSVVSDYSKSSKGGVFVESLFKNVKMMQANELLLNQARASSPSTNPKQTAWDTLTSLETSIEALEKTIVFHQKALALEQVAKELLEAFEISRREKLNTLYDSISEKFIELYRFLHSDDENSFEADLRFDGQFEVEFYGRGKYSPLALHSEGHQDSMGLCLYLALAERLTAGTCFLTVLDDVVMSVDSGHRRQICRMLKKYFPDRQFIITTHDRTWAKQLQIEDVVTSKNSITFSKWDIDTGPNVLYSGNMWTKIDAFLDSNDVGNAAYTLRNGSENYFDNVCDSLKGRIPYRSDGQYDLGDLMSASIGALRLYVKLGKVAAESWKKTDEVTKLSTFDSTIGQVIKRTNIEQWGVNVTVHHSKWHHLEKEDFDPIVDAFKDCFGLFACQGCGTLLAALSNQSEITAVQCACGTFGWSIQKK